MHGKKVTAVVALLLMFGFLTACGVSKESTAADKAETQSEAEDAIKGTNSEDGQEPLIDNGLHGECSGSDPRLQSVKVNTNSYKIQVEIPNNNLIQTSDFYGYFIMFTNDAGESWQAGFKNIVNSHETSVGVFDMETSKQNNLGTWNDASGRHLLRVASQPGYSRHRHQVERDAIHRWPGCGDMSR